MDAFKSKRFLVYIISLVVFIIITAISSVNVLESAGALSLLAGLYIGAETFKPSSSIAPIKKDPNEIG